MVAVAQDEPYGRDHISCMSEAAVMGIPHFEGPSFACLGITVRIEHWISSVEFMLQYAKELLG